MTQTRTNFIVLLSILVGSLVALAVAYPQTDKPAKTFIIHVEYNAQEDMISCPGTPGRVLIYSALPGGAADITCEVPR